MDEALDRLIVCGATKIEAQALCKQVNVQVKKAQCRTEATWCVPTAETRAQLRVGLQPAILWVHSWPDEVRILWQGDRPTDSVLVLCGDLLFAEEAPLRAETEERVRQLQEQRRNAPKTLEAAIERMIVELSDEDKATVRSTAEEDLIKFHFDWGMGIRNAWLYGNEDLMQSCGGGHPDDASQVIIHAVWKRLRLDPEVP